MKNNLGLFLAKRAFLSGDLEGYVEGDGSFRLTYRELNASCNRIANALRDAGVEKGERVGLLLMNSREFMEAYFALAKIGAVVVPLNWRLVADELEFILKDSGTKRLIFGDEFVDTVADLQSRGDKTDIVQWLQVADTAEEVAFFSDHYQSFRDAAASEEPEVTACDEDMLSLQTDVPKPTISSETEILVKGHAASINPLDKLRMKGGLKVVRPEPHDKKILGFDVSGVVQEVGSNVTNFKVGVV